MDVQETGVATFTVVRDGNATQEVKVKYKTVNGTALAGLDFEKVEAAQLIFAVGEKEKTVTFKILNDAEPEPSETFFVDLYDPEGTVHQLLTLPNSNPNTLIVPFLPWYSVVTPLLDNSLISTVW